MLKYITEATIFLKETEFMNCRHPGVRSLLLAVLFATLASESRAREAGKNVGLSYDVNFSYAQPTPSDGSILKQGLEITPFLGARLDLSYGLHSKNGGESRDGSLPSMRNRIHFSNAIRIGVETTISYSRSRRMQRDTHNFSMGFNPILQYALRFTGSGPYLDLTLGFSYQVHMVKTGRLASDIIDANMMVLKTGLGYRWRIWSPQSPHSAIHLGADFSYFQTPFPRRGERGPLRVLLNLAFYGLI